MGIPKVMVMTSKRTLFLNSREEAEFERLELIADGVAEREIVICEQLGLWDNG